MNICSLLTCSCFTYSSYLLFLLVLVYCTVLLAILLVVLPCLFSLIYVRVGSLSYGWGPPPYMFLVSDAGRLGLDSQSREASLRIQFRSFCKAKLQISASEVCTRCSCSLGSQLICFLLACYFVGFYYTVFANFVLASYFAYAYLISDRTR